MEKGMIINSKKKEIPKESIRLNSQESPEVKSVTLDTEYEITVRVKVNGINKVDRWQMEDYSYKPDDVIAEFKIEEVLNISAVKPKKGVFITPSSIK